MLYHPDILHCWGTNLSWMLAHLKNQNSFLVCSNILKNKYRTSPGHEKEYSAFIREICTALKAGYTLCKDNDKVTLLPIGLTSEHLLNCDSTGALGNGINPSFDEIEKIYNFLENNCNWTVDFQCHFDADLEGSYLVKEPKSMDNEEIIKKKQELSLFNELQAENIELNQSQITSNNRCYYK